MHFPNTTPNNPVMRGIQGHETGSGYRPMWIYTTVQSQKAASAYFRRTQILPFSFAEQHTRSLVRSKWSLHFMYKVSLGPLNMVRFCEHLSHFATWFSRDMTLTWCWNVVSATSQSDRYDPSVPRWRCHLQVDSRGDDLFHNIDIPTCGCCVRIHTLEWWRVGHS